MNVVVPVAVTGIACVLINVFGLLLVPENNPSYTYIVAVPEAVTALTSTSMAVKLAFEVAVND